MTLLPPLLGTAAIYLVCAIAIIATPINGSFFLRDEVSSISSSATVAFVPTLRTEKRLRPYNSQIITEGSHSNCCLQHLSMTSDNNSNDQNNLSQSDDESYKSKNDDELPQSETNTLSWRLAKVRLEEANKPHWLKAKPLKLSYATSQKWIRNNWAITTKQEFEDLVANGNLRTPYISKRPEEYYSERGEWISWDHYLMGDCESGDSGNGTDLGKSQEDLKWQ